MRRMGIEALYRRPRTTKPAPGHKIFPYLLRGLEITRPNQVWAMNITYIPIAKGLRLPRRRARLVLAARAVVARVDHDGSVVLRRGAGGRLGEVRQACDLQHGPGLAVHLPRAHRHGKRCPAPTFSGPPGAVMIPAHETGSI